MQRAQVWLPIGELGSHILCGQKKKELYPLCLWSQTFFSPTPNYLTCHHTIMSSKFYCKEMEVLTLAWEDPHIDSYAGALVVWRSWEKLAFCTVRSLAVVLEAVLKPPRSLSRPSALSHLSPWGIPQASADLPCWLKHLFPRNPQEKIWLGFKTRKSYHLSQVLSQQETFPLHLKQVG